MTEKVRCQNIFDTEYERKEVEKVDPLPNNGNVESVPIPMRVGFNESSPYRVLGIVTATHVHTRKLKKGYSNQTTTLGYHVREDTTGREMYMEKNQGIELAIEEGFNNAYIRVQNRNIRDKESKEIVKSFTVSYLHPINRQETFTQDDKLVTVFKLNNSGRVQVPYKLNIDKNKCTIELWRLIEVRYEKGRKKRPTREMKKDKQNSLLNTIKKSLNIEEVRNPFSDR